MVKGLIALLGLLLVCGLLLSAGGYSSPLGDTAPFDQPPSGLSVTLAVDIDTMQVVVWVAGDNQNKDLWEWNDTQSDGKMVSGKVQAVTDCPQGMGRYNGSISFWKHQPSDDISSLGAEAGAASVARHTVVHRVVWASPASACLSNEFKLVVYSPGE